MIFVITIVIFGILSFFSYTSNQRNNQRLLGLRTKEIGSLLAAVLPVVETPLASAVELANATHGSPQQFKTFIAQDVGQGGIFNSASLWNIQGSQPKMVALIGSSVVQGPNTTRNAMFHRATQTSALASSIFTNINSGEIAYAYAGVDPSHHFAVLAQSPLPRNRIAQVGRNSVFENLQFALYLGHTKNRASLLEATTLHLPIQGPNSSAVIPFGNSALTIVASSTSQLSGTISSDSWWVIAIIGIAMAIAVAAVTERLIRGRATAEDAAQEIEHLYAQQRDVAITLQQALLPEELPVMAGVEMSTRYVPGVEGLEIGGDWYDVLKLDDDCLLLVIGDVSGRGLRAATIMASLHYAIRAYALQGDEPAIILAKLGKLVDIRRDHHFATVLCARLDIKNHEVTFVNAGHPPPLLRIGDNTDFVEVPVGPPIGIPGSHHYVSVSVAITDNATLLGYTDGLVERRGEHLDEGLKRLRSIVARSEENRPFDDLLSDIVTKLTPLGPVDDVALLGLTCTSR